MARRVTFRSMARVSVLSFFTLFVLLLQVVPAPRPARAEVPGDLWETVVEASGMGMTMPATTSTSCAPRGTGLQQPPPVASMGACNVRDWKRSGAVATWTFDCGAGMTGEGRLEYAGDASYAGTMRMATPQGDMTLKLSGRRTGDCDATETLRAQEAWAAQVAQAEAAAAGETADVDPMQSTCAEGARTASAYFFVGEHAFCKGGAEIAAFCEALRTRDGFRNARQGTLPGAGIEDAARFCDEEAEPLRTRLCTSARDARDYDFLVDVCDRGLAAEVAREDCAGRSFTSMPPGPQRNFCLGQAQELLRGENAGAAPAQDEPAPTATQRGKKALKKVFGR